MTAPVAPELIVEFAFRAEAGSDRQEPLNVARALQAFAP
jgi:hypothetical protein